MREAERSSSLAEQSSLVEWGRRQSFVERQSFWVFPLHYSLYKIDYSLFTNCDSWPPACPSIQASISAIWVEGLVNFGLLQPLPGFSFSSLWDLVGLSPVPLPKLLVVSFHSIWYCRFDLWTTGFIATFRAQWKLGSSHKTRNKFLDHSFILLMLDFAATADLSHLSTVCQLSDSVSYFSFWGACCSMYTLYSDEKLFHWCIQWCTKIWPAGLSSEVLFSVVDLALFKMKWNFLMIWGAQSVYYS